MSRENLPYDRSSRIAHMIYQLVSRSLTTDLSDPGFTGSSIVRVTLTKDLSIARIYYTFSPFSESQKNKIESAWKRAAGRLRKLIGANIKLKSVPKIEFFYDSGLDAEDHITRLLNGEENVSK